MADKIVVLQEGRIEQIGAPLDLYDRPVNTFVAGFIGSPAMNMLDGVVDGVGVRVSGALLPAPADAHRNSGRRVVYGVRPEHLELADDGFEARIAVVEPTGSETMVFLRFGEAEIVALFRERHDFRPGATIRIKPRGANVHLFDAGSGARLGVSRRSEEGAEAC